MSLALLSPVLIVLVAFGLAFVAHEILTGGLR